MRNKLPTNQYRVFTTAASLFLICTTFAVSAKDLGARQGAMYEPLEWEISGVSVSGNPFDAEASATFTLQGDGATRKSLLFYVGNDTWKIRFTGLKQGEWKFDLRAFCLSRYWTRDCRLLGGAGAKSRQKPL